MRFKTDVIGAYYKSINCGLARAVRNFQFPGLYNNESLSTLINATTVIRIN